MSQFVLQTNSLTKQYGKQRAVSDVSIHVKKGAIYGLIGKNGAGKTTLMKMVSGIANPTSGEITLFGKEFNENELNIGRIGVLIENPGVYGNMTAFENLKLKAIGIGVYKKQSVDKILELVGLADAGKKKTKNFSLGMKQRLGIGLALIGNPDLLILDEPINGLDPQGIIEIRELIRRLNSEWNMTIMISSHILEELSKLVTDYGIIDKGQLLLEVSAEELNRKCARKVELMTPDVKGAAFALEENGFSNYQVMNDTTIHIFHETERIGEINKILVMKDIPVSELRVNNETLEEFFLKMTKGGKRNAESYQNECLSID